jgi:hypothetical protein
MFALCSRSVTPLVVRIGPWNPSGATWQILVPHRSRSDLLVDVAQACRALPTDDARVTRQIVLDELANRTATSASELRIDPTDLCRYLGRMP